MSEAGRAAPRRRKTVTYVVAQPVTYVMSLDICSPESNSENSFSSRSFPKICS